jgi:hypothetical protein
MVEAAPATTVEVAVVAATTVEVAVGAMLATTAVVVVVVVQAILREPKQSTRTAISGVMARFSCCGSPAAYEDLPDFHARNSGSAESWRNPGMGIVLDSYGV